jgi:hypothetical protein
MFSLPVRAEVTIEGKKFGATVSRDYYSPEDVSGATGNEAAQIAEYANVGKKLKDQADIRNKILAQKGVKTQRATSSAEMVDIG